MGPIANYIDLLEVVKCNQTEEEQWYVILLFNPLNRTPAVDIFLKNYQYLNDRSGNVRYFIPGLKNDAQLNGDVYDNHWRRFQLSEDIQFNMLFSYEGLLDTVNWLEENCLSYNYREGIDLILMKSYRRGCEAELDIHNIIYVPLEDVFRKGGNVVDSILCVRKVVIQNLPFAIGREEIRKYLERFIDQLSQIRVFIAGSKDLYHERNVVRSQLQQISNRTDVLFSSYTYEDFFRFFIKNGQQAEYDKFIDTQADFVVFIIDGRIGGITFDEFNTAMSSFKCKGHPRIFVYCKDIHIGNSEIRYIINEININHQYYCQYRDIYQLESHIYRDFMDVAWKLHHQS